jgi:NADH:ubiquinone oxidoreductase subunit 2 (subunit N)
VATGHSFVAYALFLATVASFFYYLRAVKILFFDRAPVELPRGINNGLVGRLPTNAPRRQFITALLVFFLSVYLVIVDTPAVGIISERLGVLNLNQIFWESP